MAQTVPRTKRAPIASTPPGGVRLWAPWRYTYLRAATGTKLKCIFCLPQLRPSGMRRHLVLARTDHTVVMLNRYPYTAGHVMVAPRRHVASPEKLSRAERIEVGEVMAQTVEILRAELRPAGFNLGANLGRAAGAGIADHMHWHVVPRWEGDNNFMPVLASARVLSQSLESSYVQLSRLFNTIKPGLS